MSGASLTSFKRSDSHKSDVEMGNGGALPGSFVASGIASAHSFILDHSEVIKLEPYCSIDRKKGDLLLKSSWVIWAH